MSQINAYRAICFLHRQFHAFDVPRRANSQNLFVELTVLHASESPFPKLSVSLAAVGVVGAVEKLSCTFPSKRWKKQRSVSLFPSLRQLQQRFPFPITHYKAGIP